MSSWHTTLGVAPWATADEVKAAFRKLTAEQHPDRGGDPEAYRRIVDAYREGLEADDKRGSTPPHDPVTTTLGGAQAFLLVFGAVFSFAGHVRSKQRRRRRR